MQTEKTAILLMNLGSPDEPNAPAVKRYLKEFLSDQRIINLPKFVWQPILRLAVLKVRPPKTAEAYQEVWTEEGSPLIATTHKQCEKLQQRFHDENVLLFYAMRYGSPSVKKALDEIAEQGIKRVIVFPLYPQYSRTTTESARDKVKLELRNFAENQFNVEYIEYYYNDTDYIRALAQSINHYQKKHGRPEKLIFSYHGIPKAYADRGDIYDRHCIGTTERVAQELGLKDGDYMTTFQSRFGYQVWLKPYTDKTLIQLAEDGIKHVQVLSPAFSADCLETLEELEGENREYFETAGGKDPSNEQDRTYQYISALNDSEQHINVLENLIREKL